MPLATAGAADRQPSSLRELAPLVLGEGADARRVEDVPEGSSGAAQGAAARSGAEGRFDLVAQAAQLQTFSQTHADELEPGHTVLRTVEEVASRENMAHVRNLLGCFLFRGDDVFKEVGVLSGGERSALEMLFVKLEKIPRFVLENQALVLVLV